MAERDSKGRFKKGYTPKTAFKKGYVPVHKGTSGLRNHTKDSKKKIADFRTGKSSGMLGKKHTIESRQKMSKNTKRGSDCNLWRGGITDLNLNLRNSSLYKIWRESVFLRDNFTCQKKDCEYCNNKIGVMLNAHHIKSFSKYPELRFNIQNGITYCKEYHLKEIHKTKLEEKHLWH